MSTRARRTKYARTVQAAEAHSTLETFASIERILSNGVYGRHAERTAERIRRLCAEERLFQIELFDKLAERELAFPKDKP